LPDNDMGRFKDIGLGAGAVLFGLFIVVFAVPNYVSSPSNVQAMVLAPTFWPTILGWITVLLGVIFMATSFIRPRFAVSEEDVSQQRNAAAGAVGGSDDAEVGQTGAAPWLRILALGVVMAGLVYAIPLVGMVWASMIAFGLMAIIVRTPEPVSSVLVAILLPLALYAFFSHVAGVAVPQGEFITLP